MGAEPSLGLSLDYVEHERHGGGGQIFHASVGYYQYHEEIRSDDLRQNRAMAGRQYRNNRLGVKNPSSDSLDPLLHDGKTTYADTALCQKQCCKPHIDALPRHLETRPMGGREWSRGLIAVNAQVPPPREE